MSPCTREPVCGPPITGLGLVPPSPGQARLARRVGGFSGFVDDLVAEVARERPDGVVPLAESWDLAGDPHARLLARLWAYVADGVAAYTELTASEAYLPTASDWSDLRRLAALVGYKPRPRVAAQGWVRADVERGATPTVPAGARVQAPGTPERPAQTFECAEDTTLRGEWSGLTATWPYTKTDLPEADTIRFARDPGFRPGDRVLFVDADREKPLALASVAARDAELGTSRVTFDRDLSSVLGKGGAAWAYKVLASAGTARRLKKVVTIEGGAVKPVSVPYGSSIKRISGSYVVLERLLDELSAGSRVALASWGPKRAAVSIKTADSHSPVNWEVAPGTVVPASRVGMEIATLLWKAADALTLYVLGEPVRAHHLKAPASKPAGGKLRLYPGPLVAPARVAVETYGSGDRSEWEVFACTVAGQQEVSDRGPGDALVVDLDRAPEGDVRRSPASGNLFRVRHGASATAVLGSGDATEAGQRMPVPDAPVASDLDAAGSPRLTLETRVDGIRWDERPSLYAAGAEPVYTTRLEADGGIELQFGDGARGARPATGRNNVTAAYRVGGGTTGEVESGAIGALLGRVRGVKKVRGAGPTSGGADQDDERRLRQLAPARVRALDRVVALDDAVDIALAYPGVTHATAWQGAGPSGGSGMQLAFARAGTAGVRAPLSSEVLALSDYLDARRDLTTPLTVSPAIVTRLALAVKLAVDPAHVPATVAASAVAALAEPTGPLAAQARSLGQALDPSDLYGVLHGVAGVVGVVSLTVGGTGLSSVTRRTAQRHELLLLAPAPTIQTVVA